MTGPPLPPDLPGLPVDEDGPVFAEPWQAQAFAMTVKLHEDGRFTWTEWAEALGAEISAGGPGGGAENYYLHWLAALEKLVRNKALLNADDLSARRDAWDRAARATPHGAPVELVDEPDTGAAPA